MKKYLQSSLLRQCWQFIKFGIVGLSNTFISLAVYELCVHFSLHYLLANAAGLIISVINAYYWNNRVVFGDGTKKTFFQHFVGYLKSLTAYGGTFILDSLLLVFWVEILHIPEVLAPLLNLLITIPLNFIVNKYWTFGKRP